MLLQPTRILPELLLLIILLFSLQTITPAGPTTSLLIPAAAVGFVEVFSVPAPPAPPPPPPLLLPVRFVLFFVRVTNGEKHAQKENK